MKIINKSTNSSWINLMQNELRREAQAHPPADMQLRHDDIAAPRAQGRQLPRRQHRSIQAARLGVSWAWLGTAQAENVSCALALCYCVAHADPISDQGWGIGCDTNAQTPPTCVD